MKTTAALSLSYTFHLIDAQFLALMFLVVSILSLIFAKRQRNLDRNKIQEIRRAVLKELAQEPEEEIQAVLEYCRVHL